MQSLHLWIVSFISVYVQAHTWIDNISQADNQSNLGYIRGYAGHSDAASTFLIPQSAPSQSLCKPNQQSQAYSSQYPMLKIQAGQSLVANYSENGHVTKDSLAPDSKPHPGNYTWFLAANSVSSPNPLSTIGQAYSTGTIIATGNFDDGLCAEDATKGRLGPRQCQSFVTIPSTLASGSYELIWLWNFPKVVGVVEMYSSCMDIQVVGGSAAVVPSPSSGSVSDPERTTRTSIIYQTTQIYTTVTPESLSSIPSSVVKSLSTMTTTSSTLTTNLGTHVTVEAVVQQQPANPLFDANNVAYVTEFVTMTITAKARSTN